LVQRITAIWLYSLYQGSFYAERMKHRRQFLRSGLASAVVAALDTSAAPTVFGIKTAPDGALPRVSLDNWEATVIELTLPSGAASPTHVHSGFVFGQVLDGGCRFQVEAGDENVLSSGEMFHEAAPAFTSFAAVPVPPSQQNFSLWHSAKKEER
jgi:quercetin dioxygenase-like cupin family protein